MQNAQDHDVAIFDIIEDVMRLAGHQPDIATRCSALRLRIRVSGQQVESIEKRGHVGSGMPLAKGGHSRLCDEFEVYDGVFGYAPGHC